MLFYLFGNIQITNDPVTLTHSRTKLDFMHSCPQCFHLNKLNLLIHSVQTCAALLLCHLIDAG